MQRRQKRLVERGGAAQIVEIDQHDVETPVVAGQETLRRFDHDRLAQIEPALGDRHHGLIGVDEGWRAFRDIGAHEAPHRGAADPEQQRRNGPLAEREGERHQSLVMEHQMRRVEQVHAGLLGQLRLIRVGGAERGAERSEGAVVALLRDRNRRRKPRRRMPGPGAGCAAAIQRRNIRRSVGAARRRRASSASGGDTLGEDWRRQAPPSRRQISAALRARPPTDRKRRVSPG